MSSPSKTLEIAIRISLNGHEFQTLRNGLPYILHPLHVMFQMETIEEKIVAVLHDVIEDTENTSQVLIMFGIPKHLVLAIELLTKKDGQSYEDYIKEVGANELSRKVKLQDLKHNMDISRLLVMTEKDLKRCEKYVKSYNYLKGLGNEN